jgi:hypothetical protein
VLILFFTIKWDSWAGVVEASLSRSLVLRGKTAEQFHAFANGFQLCEVRLRFRFSKSLLQSRFHRPAQVN